MNGDLYSKRDLWRQFHCFWHELLIRKCTFLQPMSCKVWLNWVKKKSVMLWSLEMVCGFCAVAAATGCLLHTKIHNAVREHMDCIDKQTNRQLFFLQRWEILPQTNNSLNSWRHGRTAANQLFRDWTEANQLFRHVMADLQQTSCIMPDLRQRNPAGWADVPVYAVRWAVPSSLHFLAFSVGVNKTCWIRFCCVIGHVGINSTGTGHLTRCKCSIMNAMWKQPVYGSD